MPCLQHSLLQSTSCATRRNDAAPRCARVLRRAVDERLNAADDQPSTSNSSAATGNKVVPLPKTGYFSLADTNMEVYSKAGEKFDPAKRGGRYKPEFIWNTNWQEALAMEESFERQRKKAAEEREAAANNPIDSAGGVSFSRLAELDSMDVDLTPILLKKKEPSTQKAASTSSRKVVRTVPLPRNDAKKLERVSRVTNQMKVTVVSTKPEDEAVKAEIAAEERVRYELEKVGQQSWTLAFTVLGGVVMYACYTREDTISYLLGALAGLTYLRMLGNSVDGIGSEGSVGNLVGQPRLLIPLVLALSYNRWNTMYADDFGLRLTLLPMLVGFLTYKLALVSRQAKQVMDDLSAPRADSQ